jgi:hypothetical protein
MGEEQKDVNPSVREQASALREEMSPRRLNEKLEETIEERPKTRFLLDFKLVGIALAAAVVIALILIPLAGAPVAAIALVVVFFGGWLGSAQILYDRRRPTRDPDAEDEEEEEETPAARSDEDEDESGADERDREAAEGSEVETSPPRQAEARQPHDTGEYQAERGETAAAQEQEQEQGEDQKQEGAAR